MSTDPFTEAARAEAERRHVPLDRPTAITEQCAVQGFQDGAEWARDYLAVPEATDAEVIAALGAANRSTLTGPRFDMPLSFYSDATVKAMRAALSAARAALREEEGNR